MTRAGHDGDRPSIGDRSLFGGQPSTNSLAVYLGAGRRSSLPTPTDLPPSPPLPSVIAHKRPPESPSLLLSAPARKRDRSVTLQLASSTFTTLRTSLSTSVLSRLGHGKGINAPPVPRPVRWESIKAISISFTLGEERGRGANQFLLGLKSLQAGGARPWDPRVEPAVEGFPDVSSTHGKEDQAPSVVVVYAGGGRRLIYPERMLPAEVRRPIQSSGITLVANSRHCASNRSWRACSPARIDEDCPPPPRRSCVDGRRFATVALPLPSITLSLLTLLTVDIHTHVSLWIAKRYILSWSSPAASLTAATLDSLAHPHISIAVATIPTFPPLYRSA